MNNSNLINITDYNRIRKTQNERDHIKFFRETIHARLKDLMAKVSDLRKQEQILKNLVLAVGESYVQLDKEFYEKLVYLERMVPVLWMNLPTVQSLDAMTINKAQDVVNNIDGELNRYEQDFSSLYQTYNSALNQNIGLYQQKNDRMDYNREQQEKKEKVAQEREKENLKLLRETIHRKFRDLMGKVSDLRKKDQELQRLSQEVNEPYRKMGDKFYERLNYLEKTVPLLWMNLPTTSYIDTMGVDISQDTLNAKMDDMRNNLRDCEKLFDTLYKMYNPILEQSIEYCRQKQIAMNPNNQVEEARNMNGGYNTNLNYIPQTLAMIEYFGQIGVPAKHYLFVTDLIEILNSMPPENFTIADYETIRNIFLKAQNVINTNGYTDEEFQFINEVDAYLSSLRTRSNYIQR